MSWRIGWEPHNQQVPYRLIHCDGNLSVGEAGAGNFLVEGDNLHALKALLPYYRKQVKCAQLIDALPKVRWWVRNLERQPDFSFWLPTPTDKFYPDFVVLLDDGRVLAVEYKGAFSRESDNAEKMAVGNLWESRSEGKCLFRFVVKEDYESKLRAIAG